MGLAFSLHPFLKENPGLRKASKWELVKGIVFNMGWRYIFFRIQFELKRKSGWLKKRFPKNPPHLSYPSWNSFSNNLIWAWGARETLSISKNQNPVLEEKAKKILEGKILLFHSFEHTFSKPEDWITNPENGYKYDNQKHWTQIADISPEAGDIKNVWEKSRFTYFHTLIRYDYHFGQDHSKWIVQEIESWMGQNPINQGPNFRCSQEISLRCFNWLGALSFYRNSPHISEEKWQKIAHYLYWQIHHVWENIQFSRIAVRNNHAITECLALYFFGILFPQLPDSQKWKEKGKAWLEEEIEYQIYPDGSYIQFSMNYHRVVLQLLTLGIRLAELAGEKFRPVVYERAEKTWQFLKAFQDPVSGKLPNYGANDGALFFEFTDLDYRVYTSQLHAMEAALYGKTQSLENKEEAEWFGFAEQPYLFQKTSLPEPMQVFPSGGFAGIKEKETLTFFRSGRHKDRPSQADNLHVDIWHQGENLFLDGGSYKYNTGESDIQYFFGSRSHNVVMVDGENQMLKGPRFVWLYWSQAIGFSCREEENEWKLSGEVLAFAHLGRRIVHKRTITKTKGKPIWKIEDQITGKFEKGLELLWHPSAFALANFEIEVKDGRGQTISPNTEPGFVSNYYGRKEALPFLVYTTESPTFTTRIFPKSAI
jgi:hypothetical protein